MTGRVFVVNCGSSSLKYRLIDLADGTAVASGTVERIGEPGGPADHAAALQRALDGLDTGGLVAVAHRVVHGGERFSRPVAIDDDVIAAIRELCALAPLHNPVNLTGIEVAREALPDVPHVAIFDTAFHSTLPAHAAAYAVPRDWAGRHGVRRYGFHGASHQFVSRRVAELLGRPLEDVDSIVLHLGNGASATAVRGGVSVDTSMGLTPLEGLVMGTRSGDLDPAVIFHMQRAGLSSDDVDAALNRSSGMLALAGSNDLREVHRRADAGDEAAALALAVYCYRVRKYVGAYYAALGRVDAVAFTAGVGENDARVRASCLEGLGALGIEVDPGRNEAVSREARAISPDGARVAVLVVPTDEELEMATQAGALVAG